MGMVRRSGGGAVSRTSLARLAVLPNRRLSHVATAIGDSRVDAVWLDATQRNRNARNPLNIANSLLGHRMIIGQTFGKSGDRTDHLFARMPGVLATRAGLLHIWCGVNNIAAVASSGNFTYAHAVTGETVTIDTVATVAFRDLKALCEMATAAGMIVILENEVGANAFTTTEKVRELHKLRQLISEYGEITPGVFVHDAYNAVMQAGTTNPTFKTLHAYDGTHENARGGFKHGKSLAALIGSFLPIRPSVLSRGAFENIANGRRQLLTNHLFLTTTGGSAASGITGSVPANFTTSLGLASAALTTAANTDGVGNYVQAVIDFTDVAGTFRLNQSLDAQNGTWHSALTVGDWVEAVAEIEVVGNPTIFAGCSLEINGFDGVANFGSMDLAMPGGPTANDVGVDEPVVLTLRTRPTQIPAQQTGANPYVAIILRARSAGAGQVTLRVRQIALRRREGP